MSLITVLLATFLTVNSASAVTRNCGFDLAKTFEVAATIDPSSESTPYEFQTQNRLGLSLGYFWRGGFKKFIEVSERYTGIRFFIPYTAEGQNEAHVILPNGISETLNLNLTAAQKRPLLIASYPERLHAYKLTQDIFSQQVLNQIFPPYLKILQNDIKSIESNPGLIGSTHYFFPLRTDSKKIIGFQLEGPTPVEPNASSWRGYHAPVKTAHSIIQVKFDRGYLEIAYFRYGSQKVGHFAKLPLLDRFSKGLLTRNATDDLVNWARELPFNRALDWQITRNVPDLKSLSMLYLKGLTVDAMGNFDYLNYVGNIVTGKSSGTFSQRAGIVLKEFSVEGEKTADGRPLKKLAIEVVASQVVTRKLVEEVYADEVVLENNERALDEQASEERYRQLQADNPVFLPK